ncbi:MAG TPA: ABC transporter substrate-binding protein [Candidatus Methylomirabilis sp.]|nr:ABC transporter substrate-binding protein [Candidatus Methylomirabilis sp.]
MKRADVTCRLTRILGVLICALAIELGSVNALFAAEVGVTNTTIALGTYQPLSGPLAPYAVLGRTIEAYFKMVNDRGGIHGRKIDLLIRDDGYNPANTRVVVKELVERDKVFAFVGGLGTPTGLAVMDYLNEHKVPHVSPASGYSGWATPPKRYLFAQSTNYAVESRLLTKYAAEQLKAKKIAVFYQNDPFGKEGLDGVTDMAKRMGPAPIATVSYERTDTDYASHAIKLLRSEADTVLLWSSSKPTAALLKEAAKIGYKPKWVSSLVNLDPVMFKLAGETWEGAIVASSYTLYNSPEAEPYREFMKKYLPNERIGGFSVGGYAMAEIMAEALRRAGPDLTREKLVKALETFKNWSGVMTHNITWGPDKRQGQNSIFFTKAEKGEFVRISGWITLDE